MLQRTYLTGLAMALLAAQACGSDDGKKKAQYEGDAGMAGQAGSPEVHAGGSSAGEAPGEPPIEGGTGGAPPEVTAGMGGVPEVILGGAGGQPSPPPDPELLFTVKGQGGTPGLPGTAVNGQEHPQNNIYTSSSGSQGRVAGTNEILVTGVDLGLDSTDRITAFGFVQPEPTNPLFLFSVADGTEGAYQSRVNRSYAQESGDEQANLYYSEGTLSTRYTGEVSDEYGYNAMLATDASLGLAGGDPEGQQYPDDLIGLAVHDKNLPLGDVYFTVDSNAAGVADSAVGTVPANERACTVFKSARDGSNSVAFTCAELGLAVDDRIDGLALWGDGAPAQVLFSVSVDSLGVADTAVWALTNATAPVGATLFTSAGDGANALLKSERELGLGERYYDAEIDGFTVVDAPAVGSVAHAASCELAYDPFDAGGGFASLTGVTHVGSNVLVLSGQTSTQTNRLLAYNATTCAFLGQKDMPIGFADPKTMAIVPLAGWTPAQPLDNVEYLGVTNFSLGAEKAISRYDAAGVFVAEFPITGSYYGYVISALVHEPVADRLYMLVEGYRYQTMFTMPRPMAADTVLTATYRDLTTPCANETGITGTDAFGNLYLAKAQASADSFRVCAFTPTGEVLPLPYGWSVDATSDARGFVVPGGSHFVIHSGDGPVIVERGAYQAP